MRHKGIKKEETRRKVVEASSRGFRKHGYAGIGVEGLSKMAGVTVGALYSHLGSKGRAFDTALQGGLDEVIEAIPQFQQQHGSDWTAAFADYYLSDAHRLDLECGCAMASLTPDVVRAGEETQQLFEQKMQQVVEVIAEGLEAGSQDEALARAWGFIGALIGGLNLARAVNSLEVARSIASSSKASAVGIALGVGVA